MPTLLISSDLLVRGKGKVDPIHPMTVDGGEWWLHAVCADRAPGTR